MDGTSQSRNIRRIHECKIQETEVREREDLIDVKIRSCNGKKRELHHHSAAPGKVVKHIQEKISSPNTVACAGIIELAGHCLDTFSFDTTTPQ